MDRDAHTVKLSITLFREGDNKRSVVRAAAVVIYFINQTSLQLELPIPLN